MARLDALLSLLAVLAATLMVVYGVALGGVLAAPASATAPAAAPAPRALVLAGEDLDGVRGALGPDAALLADGADAGERADL